MLRYSNEEQCCNIPLEEKCCDSPRNSCSDIPMREH